MFVQDWKLGLAAIALYPVQAYLIPKLQRQVNLLGKERVKHVRKLSERLGEMVSGVSDIHAHDTVQYEMADFTSRLGAIYQIRFQIYRKKFFIKHRARPDVVSVVRPHSIQWVFRRSLAGDDRSLGCPSDSLRRQHNPGRE